MIRTAVDIRPGDFPQSIKSVLKGADVYDSSCSESARVFYIDRDRGMFLKVGKEGSLQTEAKMTGYLHSLGLSAKVLEYISKGGRDFLLTNRIPGEDCTDPAILSEPEKLCDIIGRELRMLHSIDPKDCPVTDRMARYKENVLCGIAEKKYEPDLFCGLWEFPGFEQARFAAEEGLPKLKADVLIHGDYCLPNVILDNGKLSGFIDLGNSGIGDRHIDVLWGIWTLKYNLKTAKYTDRFIDAYGRDAVDPDMLRAIAAMEMIGD